MSTPRLYRVSVTYEVLVVAPSQYEAPPPARDLCPEGVRILRWVVDEAPESSLSKRERGTLPLLADEGSNPEGHTAEWFAREADAAKAREAAKRQPPLPGF